MILDLVIFILVGVSIADIISRSKISFSFKEVLIKRKWLRTLLDCGMCSGFWVGLLLSFYINPTNFIFNAFLVSLFTSIYQKISDFLENKINF